MAATVRKVYLEDQSWQQLKHALVSDSTASYHTRSDGAIRLYADDGTGTKLDVVDIYKKSQQDPKAH